MSTFYKNLKKYIQISQPLIYIRGNDEIKVRKELESCSLELNKQFEVVDYISMLSEVGSFGQGVIELWDRSKDNTVIFVSNGVQLLREREMIAFINRIATEKLEISIVVMSDSVDIPTALNPYAVTINLPLQSTDEIIEQLKEEGFNGNVKRFAQHLKGLTSFEIHQLIRRANNGEKIEELGNKLNQGDCSNNEFLSFVDVTGEEDLGGFSKLKEKLENAEGIFKNIEDARSKKVPIPKGYMLVGIPGCGKSLAAKITAKKLEIPLLKMEFGKIMNKYVGESEANLFFALRFAEEYAPCVLWLDEFEKSIISSSDGGADGNISNRLLGIFLNWLQEKSAPVYVVATVNNVDKMPPELLRRGRFDEIYKVEIPKPAATIQIMNIQLKKYGIRPEENDFNDKDIKKFCSSLRDYSGADIEELVKEVKKMAYVKKVKITIGHFEAAKSQIQSVEDVMHKQIQKIREVFEEYNFMPVD